MIDHVSRFKLFSQSIVEQNLERSFFHNSMMVGRENYDDLKKISCFSCEVCLSVWKAELRFQKPKNQ